MKHPEYNLQKSVCTYLNHQYPNVLFLSDTIAAVKLTIIQGARNKAIQKEGFKTPDLIILKPNSKYHGLFIELKIKSPFKKNGDLKANEHLEGQQKTLNQLSGLGYFACFGWEFSQIKVIIDNYMETY